MKYDCTRRVIAEAVGTGFLLSIIVGSGIMGSRLAAEGGEALILGPHSLAVGGILFVMIRALGPVSGAHFNPAVTMAFLLRREIDWREAAFYVMAQVVGGVIGVLLTHITFGEPILQVSVNARDGFPLLVGEVLATAGLVGVILATMNRGSDVVAGAVAAYIALAIWSTSSTCFANPAVTIARLLTDSYTGIAPSGVPGFIVAQVIGGVVGTFFFGWLLSPAAKEEDRG